MKTTTKIAGRDLADLASHVLTDFICDVTFDGASVSIDGAASKERVRYLAAVVRELGLRAEIAEVRS